MEKHIKNYHKARALLTKYFTGRKRLEQEGLRAARAIAKLCALNDLMHFECKDNNWDEEICYVAQEALLKLGNVLARLTIWYEDEEEE